MRPYYRWVPAFLPDFNRSGTVPARRRHHRRTTAGVGMQGSGISLRLLGEPSIEIDRQLRPLAPGSARLVTYLVLGPRGRRQRSIAAAELYPDSPTSLARRRLNTAAWRLNKEMRVACRGDLVVTAPGGDTIGVNPGLRIRVDAWDFSDAVGVVLHRPPDSTPPAEIGRMEQALALYRGQLALAVDEPWVISERSRLQNLYLIALNYLIRHYGAIADLDAISRCGELALAAEPGREDIHRALMQAYARADRIDLAESQFERCRITLQQSLGVAPMPETIEIFRRLRTTTDDSGTEIAALLADLAQARRDLGQIWARLDKAVERVRRLR